MINRRIYTVAVIAVGMAVSASFIGTALASSDSNDDYKRKQEKLGERYQEYVFGVPEVPTPEWVMSSGGRYYDNWMNALDKEPLTANHPSLPATNTKKTRC